MSRGIRRAVLLGIIFATPQLGLAQDREFPVLNSVGRYFGVGYTRGGYHAPRDGRFDIVTDRHPASEYRGGGLSQHAMPYFYAPATYSAPPEPIKVPAGMVPASNALPGAAAVSPVTSSTSSPPFAVSRPQPAEAAAGLESGLATGPTTPPSPSTKPLQQNPPAVLISPRDRIEVRELTPETSPSDALLEGNLRQPLPAQDVAYSIVDAGLAQQPARPSVPATQVSEQRQPPILSSPRRSQTPSGVNRYRGPWNPRY